MQVGRLAVIAFAAVLAACAKSPDFVSPADSGGGAWIFKVQHLRGASRSSGPQVGGVTPLVVLGSPADGASPEEVAGAMRMPAQFGGGGFRLVAPASPEPHLALGFGTGTPAALCEGGGVSPSANPEVVQNQIGALRNLVNQAAHNTHNILFELRPVTLEVQGLVAACKRYADQLRQMESFTVHYNSNVEQAKYSTKITNAIFAIMQEAVNNAKRHANADNLWLSLEAKDNQFIVTVRDNGQGFDTGKIEAMIDKQAAYGLLNMRERAASIHADLQIRSKTKAPNQGSLVQLTLPWPPENATSTA